MGINVLKYIRNHASSISADACSLNIPATYCANLSSAIIVKTSTVSNLSISQKPFFLPYFFIPLCHTHNFHILKTGLNEMEMLNNVPYFYIIWWHC